MRRKYIKPSKKFYFLFMFIGVALTIGLGFVIDGQKVHADAASTIPANRYGTLTSYDCQSAQADGNRLYLPSIWISPPGSPKSDSVVNVQAGKSTVGMQINQYIFLHHSIVKGVNAPPCSPAILPPNGSPASNAALRINTTNVVSASFTGASGNLSGVGSGTRWQISYDGSNRYWFNIPVGFSFNSSSPLENSTTIKITITTQQINTFHDAPNQQYFCVMNNSDPAIQVNGPQDFSGPGHQPCPSTPAEYDIQVNVTHALPIISTPTNCNTTGFILDTDRETGTGSQIFYSLINTDTGKVEISSAQANQPYPKLGFHGYDLASILDASNYQNGKQHNLEIVALGVDTNGTQDHANNKADFTFGPCPSGPAEPTCQVSPTSIPVGVPTQLTFSITYNAADSGGVLKRPPNNLLIKVTGQGINYNNGNAAYNPASFGWPAAPPTNTTTFQTSAVTASSAGTINVTANLTPFGALSGCNSPTAVTSAYEPYVRIYGGDTFAGTSDNTSNPAGCSGWGTENNNAGIYGFNGSASNLGSATQLALAALGLINSFSSAANRISGPQPPIGLDFANSNSLQPGYAGLAHCPYDYLGNEPANVGPATPGNTLDLNAQPANADNDFSVATANSVLSANLIAPTGIKSSATGCNSSTTVVTVYVKGDVVIKAPGVQYNGSGDPGSHCGGIWANENDIPRVKVVASGSIYIDKSITQLDGIYVSQGGTIYTCVDTSGATPIVVTAVNLYSQCRTQLTINGALLGTHIKWSRTYGSVTDSTAGEQPYGGTHHCNSSGSNNPTCAAEIVNFSPEEYLVQPPSNQPIVSTPINYLANLPPLL